MRLFLVCLLALSLPYIAKANSCSGAGFLQNIKVSVRDARFYSCKAQGLICFEIEVANKEFRQKIEMTFRFQGRQKFFVIGDSLFAKNGNQGIMEYDLKTGYRRVYIEDSKKNRKIDFIFNCLL